MVIATRARYPASLGPALMKPAQELYPLARRGEFVLERFDLSVLLGRGRPQLGDRLLRHRAGFLLSVEPALQLIHLEMLHTEYLAAHPGGLGYTRFCDIYRAWLKRQKLSPTAGAGAAVRGEATRGDP